MAIININNLKQYFLTGLKPTQQQFWNLIDSFRHKNDPIPALEVDGLQDLLDQKLDAELYVGKPIHKNYENITALTSDQSSQIEGYFYGIEDATGFGNITNGRATVSYKGTTNGNESDYDIEWRDENSLITKKNSSGVLTYYKPDENTNASRGAKLLEVLNAATSGDYITVYQGTYEAYIPIQPNLDNVTIDFKDGAILIDDGTRDLISNDNTYDITLNIVGKGTFINTSNVGNQNRAINIDDGTILNIEGKSIISETGVCIRTAQNSGGGSTITANFDYYKSKDGTFDNVDAKSVINVYGNYALSTENFVLENDGGVINCWVKKIESLGLNPVERGLSGVINIYKTHIIAPSGEILAFNTSPAENLNFYNCTGVCDVAIPIQTNYKGTVFINSDFHTDSNATLEEKTDKTPVVKKDLENFVNTTNNQTINGIKTFNNNVTVKELFLIENPNGSIKKAYSLTGNEGLRVDIGTTMPNFFTIYDNSATNQVVFQVMQTSLGGHILFQPNGNIGIGLPNPSEKVEVNGKIKANSILLKSPDGNYHEYKPNNAGVLELV